MFSEIITFCIAMLYKIAHALNQPFGFDVQDVKLNRLCAEYSYDCLVDFATINMDLSHLIIREHDTPTWLEHPLSKDNTGSMDPPKKRSFIPERVRRLLPGFKFKFRPARQATIIGFFFFVLWSCIVLFATWSLTRNTKRSQGVRWWYTYVPIGSGTVGYLSLAVFLLLAFWIGDAYSRYWRGLQTWQSRLRTSLNEVAFQISLCCKRGLWRDPRDRERIFSFLAALPYAAKATLRNSRNVEELSGILGLTDVLALEAAPNTDLHVLSVLYAYISSADAKHIETFSGLESPFTATVYNILYTLWEIETAISECKAMRKFPLSPAFTTHLKVFIAFWLILLPWTTLLYSGFFSFVYILPIGYIIINSLSVGLYMSDPFGFDDDDIPLTLMCDEMRDSIHRIYLETLDGPRKFVHASDYRREMFSPKPGYIIEKAQLASVPDKVTASSQDEVSPIENDNVQSKVDGASVVITVEQAQSDESVPRRKSKQSSEVSGSGEEDELQALKEALQNLTKVPLKVFAFFRKVFNIIRFIVRLLIRLLGYNQVRFNKARPRELRHGKADSFRLFCRRVLALFPKVPVWSLSFFSLWSFIAVFLSFALSKLWDGDRQANCPRWCSPIGVEQGVIENTAFALFLLMAFHSSSAVGRYDDGARLIFNLEMNLRNVAVEIVQTISDGCFHVGDKERIVAHLVQIPLCLRDMLLHEGQPMSEDDGLLSIEDRKTYTESSSPIEYLLQTVEAYFLAQDGSHRAEIMESVMEFPRGVTITILNRLSSIRSAVAWILAVKRFPVVRCYTSLQHFFTKLWLFLLPLAMTANTGFFTILWAPLISYAVLCLDSLATKLIDPFGDDDIDLEVDDLCISATNAILDAVNSVEWGSSVLCRSSLREVGPSIGCVISGHFVKDEYTLAHLRGTVGDVYFDNGSEGGDDEVLLSFAGPRKEKVLPSLFGYFTRSTRWWVFLVVTAWSAVATMFSFLIRERSDGNVRWWLSVIASDESVAAALSFVTFVMLGLYLDDAFARYNAAANVWLEGLQNGCHTLVSQFLLLTPRDSIHVGDHDRIVGHIAAIPLLLKREVRDSRDVREVKGLVSLPDLARIECAPSPSEHCLDVLRSYVFSVQCHPEIVKGDWVKPRSRAEFIMQEIKALEQTIRNTKYVTQFQIAPGFMGVLKVFLTLWFVMIPFTIAEYSGWFTILYMPIMAHGLLGMYSLGAELQHPYGRDLNDLDLDVLADGIVANLLEVEMKNRGKWVTHVRAVAQSNDWLSEDDTSTGNSMTKSLFVREEEHHPIRLFKTALRDGKKTIPRWLMSTVIIWTFGCVIVSFIISRAFKLDVSSSCRPWFCSAIALYKPAIEFLGFALFMLLGLRLYHSQHRYVDALNIWEDGLIGTSRVFTNRLFLSYRNGTWHEGDLARIGGFIAAYSICIMGALRNRDYREKLEKVLAEEDVNSILAITDRPAYCIDVVRSYLIDGERLASEQDVELCSAIEHWKLLWYLRQLSRTGRECLRIKLVPVPFGYQVHLRVFLGIWLMLLPFALVEATGWLTMLWVPFVAYAVIGLEAWAERLSDPFGDNDSVIPLEALSERVVTAIKTNMRALQVGTCGLIYFDRSGFPGNVEDRPIQMSPSEV